MLAPFRQDGWRERVFVAWVGLRGAVPIVLAAYPVLRGVPSGEQVFDIVSRHRLHFDHTSHTGVVLHMLSAVGDLGNLGATAIANTAAEADALYNRFVAVLDEEAHRSLQVEH